MIRRDGARRSGVTLLELLLALALTGLIMVLIGMAIELNLRTLESGRKDVERAQLAAAVLRHIASDLHNAVISEPLDLSSVPAMSGGGDLGALAEGGESLLSEEAGDSFGDLLGGSEEMDAEMTDLGTDIAGSVVPTNQPGLFGSQYELQVDVSRLPRVDQYEQVFLADAGSVVVDIPSDVKTVAYFLQTDGLTTGVTTAAAGATGSETVSGLARREMDRAVTAWASQNGGLDTEATSGQILAPEVNYIEFRYFDGLEWLAEWDSQSSGGLPVAVEVIIGIDPAYGLDPAAADVAAIRELAAADMTEYMYRLVVRLPTARPVVLDDESLETMGL